MSAETVSRLSRQRPALLSGSGPLSWWFKLPLAVAACGGEPSDGVQGADMEPGAGAQPDAPSTPEVNTTSAPTDGVDGGVDAPEPEPDGVPGGATDGDSVDVSESGPSPRSIASVVMGACAIDPAGALACWGGEGAWTVPPGRFQKVAAEDFVCGLTPEGALECFDIPRPGVGLELDFTPPGQFVDLAVGTGVCVLDGDGLARCEDSLGYIVSPPEEPLLDISVGGYFACGIRASDRGISCWGGGNSSTCSQFPAAGQLDAPEGEFAQLDSTGYHSCAVRTNGELACWGVGEADASPDPDCELAQHHGQSDPPPGIYIHVAVGNNHGCAIRTDGTVTCWGAGTEAGDCSDALTCGQAVPPDGQFVELSASIVHTCGVRIDGTIECWGSNYGDRLIPPPEFQ